MRILYDHQAFQYQKYGGVSNCFVKLIENLPPDIDYEIAICETDNEHLRNSNLVDVPKERLSFRNFISHNSFKGKSRLYNTITSILPFFTTSGRNLKKSIELLNKQDFDVFHPTYFDGYFLPYLKNKPFVLTVHDMIPELMFKKVDLQARMKPILCDKAAHIIAVSEKTKKDLVDILNVPQQKISVIYHGAPDKENSLLSTPIMEGKYILYVGMRHLYKNFIPMVKSLVPILHRRPDISIVCTGPDFTDEENRLFKTLRVERNMIHMRASDEELVNLYRFALCFIYPSEYEGFGIPILEAYKAKCPVLLNHASCFPEIAGDAAVYFHLDNIQSDLNQVMEQFLNFSVRERLDLLARQNERLKRYSWEKSARKLAEIYRNL
ncbi:mannosyltransferase [Xylanibacter ruminicola]|uniref:Glycosyltransferase, group 1 family n=2 Tax=Xylanibacter ruminicola TaxID=839 RepID=D5EX47_XYLR2|nr:glycosyltransferase family 1 protein [Xylanibacter ruminicola]ADE82350.1 glycosyltransferase, group 1 family [Xylanibacter ruminicola 23]GJG32847.1 mannosyltransferase [Xylanibacter ruminicola]SEH98648.1 Glycosyltransferase involved in cell wall bisynthesis [Xylanibacter ruminicola]